MACEVAATTWELPPYQVCVAVEQQYRPWVDRINERSSYCLGGGSTNTRPGLGIPARWEGRVPRCLTPSLPHNLSLDLGQPPKAAHSSAAAIVHHFRTARQSCDKKTPTRSNNSVPCTGAAPHCRLQAHLNSRALAKSTSDYLDLSLATDRGTLALHSSCAVAAQ